MMWSVRVRLISSISEASVVDLPEPVGPVTRTSPRGFVVNSCSDGRKLQLLERLDVRGDGAERRGEALALVVGVDAEAGESADAVGEVELPPQLEVLLLLGRRDPVDELPDEVGIEHRENRREARCDRAGERPATSRTSGAGRMRRAATAFSSRASTESRAGLGCSESSTVASIGTSRLHLEPALSIAAERLGKAPSFSSEGPSPPHPPG